MNRLKKVLLRILEDDGGGDIGGGDVGGDFSGGSDGIPNGTVSDLGVPPTYGVPNKRTRKYIAPSNHGKRVKRRLRVRESLDSVMGTFVRGAGNDYVLTVTVKEKNASKTIVFNAISDDASIEMFSELGLVGDPKEVLKEVKHLGRADVILDSDKVLKSKLSNQVSWT